jgi:SAM-dependent methyltransferase
MLSVLKNITRPARIRARAWVSESPSTRDLRLICYEIRKHGLWKVFTQRYYDDAFYEDHLRLRPAYDVLASALDRWAHPASVCDFGCGNGYLLSYFAARGVCVTGVEGFSRAVAHVDVNIRDRVVVHDLAQSMSLPLHDLVVCTEVAEHLPKRASKSVVANLTNSAGQHIAFSAAQPGQWGDGHINCQPVSFWLRLFSDRGWVADDGALDVVRAELEADAAFREQLPWILSNLRLLRPDARGRLPE